MPHLDAGRVHVGRGRTECTGFNISSMSGVLGTQAYKRYFGNPISYRQGGITAFMSAGYLLKDQSTRIGHATSEVGSLSTGVDAIASQEGDDINDLPASFSVISMDDAMTGAKQSLIMDVEPEAALSQSLGNTSDTAKSDEDESWLMMDEDES
ncbi:Uu.00g094560.m01.CDS01 [Anthostomella pinea]|uniref:Uu.00g094560.m01.CDS01 n=1 Tax=Anthostomella pinea TaxID=933095 RepID=A0AAI8VNP6_9PEZI|nr:Uu.00g094560.m01.CDS01 [Anthostomella pinea]